MAGIDGHQLPVRIGSQSGFHFEGQTLGEGIYVFGRKWFNYTVGRR